MWLLILIVVILLLRAMATSKTAANVTQVTKTVCSAPTAGDSFTQGNTIAAGVPEPQPRPIGPARPTVHCCHITVGTFYCGLPSHVVYPIAPPPVKIQQPAPVAPPKFAPNPPILSYPKPGPMPVSPKIYFMSSPAPSAPLIAPTCVSTAFRGISRCNVNPAQGAVGYACVMNCDFGSVG